MLGMKKLILLKLFLFLSPLSTYSQLPSSSDILNELNLARTAPKAYSALVSTWASSFNGTLLEREGLRPLETVEGQRAVEEAMRFLLTVVPLQPLSSNFKLSEAAR